MEELADKAAIYLEENHISGDVMVNLDHNLEELPENKRKGAMYVADILACFAKEVLQDSFRRTTDAPVQR